jgi:hypothetical protein
MCNEVMIFNHQERIQVDCEQMLKEERIEDLKCMYNLLTRIEDGIKVWQRQGEGRGRGRESGRGGWSEGIREGEHGAGGGKREGKRVRKRRME